MSVDLDWFEYKFDDLLETKTAISYWMKRPEKPLTKEQEKKVRPNLFLYETFSTILRKFYSYDKIFTTAAFE